MWRSSLWLCLLVFSATIICDEITPRNIFTIIAHHSFPDFQSVALDFQSVLDTIGVRGTVLSALQQRDVNCNDIQPDYLYMISGISGLPCSDDVVSLNAQSLIDELEGHDITWRAYFEGYPSPSFFPLTSEQCSLSHDGTLFTNAQVTCNPCESGTPQTSGHCALGGDECVSWCCGAGGASACLSAGGCFLDSIGLDGLVVSSTNYKASTYSRLRNPFVSFDNIISSSSRCAKLVDADLIDFNNLPQYAFYVPNNQHSQGSPNVAAWLLESNGVFQRLLSGGYDGLISIVFDNADLSEEAVYAIVIDPLNQQDAPHTVLAFENSDATTYSHASFLRAVEINFGLDVVVKTGGEVALTDDNSATAVRAIALRDGCSQLNEAGECIACADANALTAVEAGIRTTLLNFCVCKEFYFDLDKGTAWNQMHCLAPAGVTCTSNQDCTTGVCNGDADQPGTCQVVGAGMACIFDDDCASYRCDQTTFTCQVSALGDDCLTNVDCAAGLFCYDGNLYTSPEHTKTFDATRDFQSFTCQVNACATSPNGDCGTETEGKCVPTAPGVRACYCAPNFIPTGAAGADWPACVANPCGAHSDFCGPHAHCHAVLLTPEQIITRREERLPAVEPVCTCNDGFVSFSANGGNCVRNGCMLFPACAEHAECKPNPTPGPKQGFAVCKCKKGYEGTGDITTGGCHKRGSDRRRGNGLGEGDEASSRHW